ncbi:unnamed protein product [Moneuplotes crassus]|uniref:asparagine--tRNA ligase n=1 Tax=Euplotes crassus TaxID=5936 RepID=A0AAD1UGA2_EUPCR|nr:unnamed protein product [Moneuplotes crassus]
MEPSSTTFTKRSQLQFKPCPSTSLLPYPGLQMENTKTLDPVIITKKTTLTKSYSKRFRLSTFFEEESNQHVGTQVKVYGWAKAIRAAAKGAICFIQLNDGPCVHCVQVVVDQSIEGYEQVLVEGVGASFQLVGTLVESVNQKKQRYELQVCDNEIHSVKVLGTCPQAEYPLSKKKHTKEFLREIMHLRPRTNLIGVLARIRNSLAFATHEFFRKEDSYMFIHLDGTGEMFQVTTNLPNPEASVSDLKLTQEGKLDYSKDFFKKPTFLTVSAQLNAESYACGLSDVYTFAPTFRAEISHTKKHLAELWSIEPEMAFADITDNMDCIEEFIKYCINYMLANNKDDVEWLEKNEKESKKLISNLLHIVNNEFERVSYTEAIQALQKKAKKAKFDEQPEWGIDLKTEHERFLTEKIYKKPILIYNYPKALQAFYVRDNEDGLTVASMHCLVPVVGELVTGSQREERFDLLDQKIRDAGLSSERYSWYLDLRKYGSVPHSGFGIKFERLLMLCTQIENIKDVIPFPRWPGHADF